MHAICMRKIQDKVVIQFNKCNCRIDGIPLIFVKNRISVNN